MSLQLQQENVIRRATPLHSKIPGYVETSEPIYYNHATKTFTLGEYAEFEPKLDNVIWNLEPLIERNMAVKSAGVDNDPLGTALAGVNPQLYGKAQEIMEAVLTAEQKNDKNYMKYIKNAAILKREDFTNFKTVVAQTKILAAKPKKHILLDLINIDNVTEFNTKIYSFDGPWDMVQENLPELNVPFITGFPSFSSQTFGMERYGLHYAMSEEFIAETFDFNIRQFVVDNIAGQFQIVFTKKFADLLNTQTTFTPYSSWTTKTANVSDNNPVDHINAEATKLTNNLKNEGMVLVSNRKVYNAYQSNYFTSGYGTPQYKQPGYSFDNAEYTNIPQFTGLNWGVDSFTVDNKFLLFDPSTILAQQMPERIVNYKSPYETHEGTIVRKNMIIKPLDTTRMIGGSGITV